MATHFTLTRSLPRASFGGAVLVAVLGSVALAGLGAARSFGGHRGGHGGQAPRHDAWACGRCRAAWSSACSTASTPRAEQRAQIKQITERDATDLQGPARSRTARCASRA